MRLDTACGRLNAGLMALAVVLAALVLFTAVYRAAEVCRFPEGYTIVATT